MDNKRQKAATRGASGGFWSNGFLSWALLFWRPGPPFRRKRTARGFGSASPRLVSSWLCGDWFHCCVLREVPITGFAAEPQDESSRDFTGSGVLRKGRLGVDCLSMTPGQAPTEPRGAWGRRGRNHEAGALGGLDPPDEPARARHSPLGGVPRPFLTTWRFLGHLWGVAHGARSDSRKRVRRNVGSFGCLTLGH